MKTCAHCGTEFEPTSSKMRNRNYQALYCSVACSNRARVIPMEERFWSHVDTSGGADSCWPWTAVRDRDGYGLFTVKAGKQRVAHGVALELTLGRPLAAGKNSCHHCDNPPCCNPAHLFEGTPAENSHDRDAKGRQQRGERHHRARLTADDVRAIRQAYASGESQQAISTRYGVTQVNISSIVRRETWKQVP